ncbi:hypothetical protein AB1Y20_002699 [Prymnesium parvum]|uniref:Cellulase n=1 Tax=Prymnesium parvum TaxID=97485 RepID=A0AB34J9W8_PRYPA
MKSLLLVLLASARGENLTGNETNGSNLTAPPSAPPPPAEPLCIEGFPPELCSSAWDVCGTPSANRRKIGEKSQVCIGFESRGGGGAAVKAVFHATVDVYSRLRATALIPVIASGNWSVAEPYSFMFLAAEGHRSVGQTRGVVSAVGDDGSVNCTTAANGAAALPDNECSSAAVGCACFGWINQSKPVITPEWKLSTALTAIIHMKDGIVTHIAWDSQCNLCQGRNDGSMTCQPDGSDALCTNQNGWGEAPGGGGPGPCTDCYLELDPATCNDASCAPTVYVAWEGTDANGMPLLSGGAILSRFQAFSLNGVYDELVDEVREVGTRRRLADAWL